MLTTLKNPCIRSLYTFGTTLLSGKTLSAECHLNSHSRPLIPEGLAVKTGTCVQAIKATFRVLQTLDGRKAARPAGVRTLPVMRVGRMSNSNETTILDDGDCASW